MVLAALVLPLEGPHRPQAAHLRGWFYSLLGPTSPFLHDSAPNPFTLAVGGREGHWWIRITFLHEDVYAQLSPQLFVMIGREIRLGSTQFRIKQVLQESHPWAGLTTYAQLFARELSPDAPLLFATPTFFRRKEAQYPLPESRLVWGSLIDRWNNFAPAQIPPTVAETLKERTTLRFLQIHTLPVEAETRTVGFVGRVTFHLTRATPEEMGYLGALSRFAFYSGVGAKTSVGCGRVRTYRFVPTEPPPDPDA